jgi:hypothetical protein
MTAPADCTSSGVYRAEIRRRFATDPAARQQLEVIPRRRRGAQHHGPVPVTGPFAGKAREILAYLQERRR